MTTVYTNKKEKNSFTVVKTRDVFKEPITPPSSEYETEACEEEKLGEKADKICPQELIDSFVIVDIQNDEEQVFQPDGSQCLKGTCIPSASSGPQSIPPTPQPEDEGSMADVDSEEEKEEDPKKSKSGGKTPGKSNWTDSCVTM